jgi:hypothetical protein
VRCNAAHLHQPRQNGVGKGTRETRLPRRIERDLLGTAPRSARRNSRIVACIMLKRDEIGLNRHRALAPCLSMIFSENRFALFRIML